MIGAAAEIDDHLNRGRSPQGHGDGPYSVLKRANRHCSSSLPGSRWSSTDET
jgi:hypothetical protein